MVNYLEELELVMIQLRNWKLIASLMGRPIDGELIGQALVHLEQLKTRWETEQGIEAIASEMKE